MPVGKGQFKGFNQDVEIGRGVVAHFFQLKAGQNLEDHEQSRTLAPWTTTVYLVAFVTDPFRRFNPNGKGG